MQNDISDYTKYRWVLSTSYLTCWTVIILGPFFFPSVLEIFVDTTNYYGVLRLLYMIGCAVFAVYKVLTVPRYRPDQFLTASQYAWVIPSYRQPEQIIAQTLEQLAKHPRAKSNYLILLAMEQHEQGSREKAERVICRFRDKFYFIGYNVHTIKEGEAKGKASNVSSCVQNLERILPPGQFNLSQLFITIMDCDSFAPAQYIDEVNAYIYNHPEKAKKCVFNPTQIFKRNDQEVPVTTRSFDNYHCYAHWTTAVSYFEFSAPFSNYTLSYDLIKSVGFWDKHSDAMAEDIHTFNKLFWLKQGDAYSITISVPFNQLNVQCSGSYLDNIKQKFWQAVRHGHGIQEVCYNLQGFQHSKKSFRDIVFTGYFLDTVMVHTCFSTYIMLFQILRTVYYNFLLYVIGTTLTLYQRNAMEKFEFIGPLATSLNLISIVFYEIYKRYSNKRFYNGKNESWLKIWEYFVFLGFGVYAFFATSFLWATFKRMFKTIEYRVGAKDIGFLNNTTSAASKKQ